MTLFEAILLGILQGLTEFLPVSSSGHLELANALFGITEGDNLAFTMVVHAATVLSIIVVFWRKIVDLLRGLSRFRLNPETLFCINIFVSMLPILFVGMFFRDQIEALFTSNLLIVGIMLIVTAALLAFADRAKPKQGPITPTKAFIIGLAQAVAILPGLSRSGATISTGLLLGVKREEAAEFSFLMVLIPILGVNILELLGGGFSASGQTINLAAGFIAAFITGTLACRWMINVVKKRGLIWFALYCLVVGVASLIIYSIV